MSMLLVKLSKTSYESIDLGPVSNRDNRVLRKGHSVVRYVRSLTPLTPLTRSIHGLAHSLRSRPRGTVAILEYVFTL